MNQKYDLYSEFDIHQHKKTYIHYLEVVLFSDGHVEYAVPSHQEKLIAVCCNQLGVSREQLNDMCPQSYYFDFATWLCNMSRCCMLWESMVLTPEYGITPAQMATLGELVKHRLYLGDIPEQAIQEETAIDITPYINVEYMKKVSRDEKIFTSIGNI